MEGDVQLALRAHIGDHGITRGRRLADAGAQLGDVVGGLVDRIFDQEGLAVREVVVHRGAADTGGRGDPRERDRLELLGLQQLGERGEDLLPRALPMLLEGPSDDLGHAAFLHFATVRHNPCDPALRCTSLEHASGAGLRRAGAGLRSTPPQRCATSGARLRRAAAQASGARLRCAAAQAGVRSRAVASTGAEPAHASPRRVVCWENASGCNHPRPTPHAPRPSPLASRPSRPRRRTGGAVPLAHRAGLARTGPVPLSTGLVLGCAAPVPLSTGLVLGCTAVVPHAHGPGPRVHSTGRSHAGGGPAHPRKRHEPRPHRGDEDAARARGAGDGNRTRAVSLGS